MYITFLNSVDTGEIDRKLIMLMGLKHELKLNDVCKPTTLEDQPFQLQRFEEGGLFNHPQEVQDMLQPLVPAFKSALFYRALQNKANDVLREKEPEDITPLLSLIELATKVWQPVYDSMERFVNGLLDASISLMKINDLLRHFDNPGDLKQEIDKVRIINPYCVCTLST